MTSTQLIILKASPGTDIWRKPPHTNIFKVPKHTTSTSIAPLSRFRSARISFSFAWTEQYDQGGLVLSFRRSSASAQSGTPGETSSIPEKWIKTGVEFYNGTPMVGTVACDSWADWSLAPLNLPTTATSTAGPGVSEGDRPWITVQIERDGDQHGTSLWVYQIGADGSKLPLREVCWVYGGAEEDVGKWTLEVAGFAARPEKGTQEALEVKFKDFEVKWD
jgi:uncharacterized protein